MSAQPCGCDSEHCPTPYLCAMHAQKTLDAQQNAYVQQRERYIRAHAETATAMNLNRMGRYLPPTPAPSRVSTLSTTAQERKARPVGTGVLDYFPDALVAVAHCSYVGNEQHNPGQPLHWDRSKSTDEADALIRHFMERGTLDTDGVRHSAKLAWRALALLQKEIEASVNQKESEPAYRARMGFDAAPVAEDLTPDGRYSS